MGDLTIFTPPSMHAPSAHPGQAPENAAHGSSLVPADSELHEFLEDRLSDAKRYAKAGNHQYHPKIRVPLDFIDSIGKVDAHPNHRANVAATLHHIIGSTEVAACAVFGPLFAGALDRGGFSDLAVIVREKVEQTTQQLKAEQPLSSEV